MLIAVFTRNQQQYSNFRMYPKKVFVKVKDVSDIEGRKFNGVITYADWYFNDKVVDAHEILQRRQPELFEMKKRNKTKDLKDK